MFALQLKKWRNFNNLFDDPGLNGGVDQEGWCNCNSIFADPELDFFNTVQYMGGRCKFRDGARCK